MLKVLVAFKEAASPEARGEGSSWSGSFIIKRLVAPHLTLATRAHISEHSVPCMSCRRCLLRSGYDCGKPFKAHVWCSAVAGH